MTQPSTEESPKKVEMVHRLALMEQALFSRQALLEKLIDPRRDFNKECGYPDSIDASMYRVTYDRLGLGHRVVEVWPDECWQSEPNVFETSEGDETEFEAEWQRLKKRLNLFHMLHRIDEVSGIGRYGVLLLGLSDGKPLDQPVEGVERSALRIVSNADAPARKLDLLYLRAFDESVVTIDSRETDTRSPRFGQPKMYSVIFQDDLRGTGTSTTMQTAKVHWTRVIHIADNRQLSEVYGTPRMQIVFDRLMDVKKVLGGSGEMFWRGAFPGTAFEISPGIIDSDLDKDSFRDELENYANGLQRYLSLVGIKATSLAPQVADPTPHYDAFVKDISITLGIPMRVFMGSEQAQLASEQDRKAWNNRVMHRDRSYLTPMLIRPFVDRLLEAGVLPPLVEDSYEVEWPDLNTSTDTEKADLAAKMTDSLSKYIGGNVDQLIPPLEYLVEILGMDPKAAEDIIKAADEFQANQPEPPAPPPPPAPTPQPQDGQMVPQGA